MPVTLTYHPETKALYIKVTGHLLINDYKQAAAEILQSTDYPSDTAALWDLTEMKFDNIDIEFEKKLIALRQAHNEERGAAKIAIVCDYSFAEPIIKLFKILSKPLKQNLQSFNNFYEAEHWLLNKKDHHD